ncbi:acyl-CoA dehydrogenase family protein [Bacteriovoracaceae bacterium]|nr:acyl-CoA dehydrogenase family protein [Bacteriovoracaceae bacterium]
MNYFSDESEWQWLFKNAIDWDTILPLYYPSYPSEEGLESKEEVEDFLKEILTNTGEWAGTSLLEKGDLLDKEGAGEVRDGKTHYGPVLQQIINEAKELQVFGLLLPREYGGLETPALVYMMFLNQVARSCISSSTLIAFYTSLGDMVHRFCDQETIERLVPQVVAGDISGSMNLTEPGCGSDLSMIKTQALPQENGTYLLNGQKIFITNGGGGIQFVLAKVKGAPDTLDGISMFFVEQDIEVNGEKILNYSVDKSEEKMGMHGSFTTVISYENSVAKLVGEEGKGFKYMLHLMNEARIVVAIQSLGGIEGALGYARKYADERIQFGKPISELPLMKRNLEDFETERDALRALIADTMSWFDIYLKLDSKKVKGDLSKEESDLFKEASIWTRKRTPLVKYYATEAYTDLSKKAIQVLGGYGFIQEYPVERYHRDSFGPLLYEGTSQIQALMALKDIIKYAMSDPKKFFSNMIFKHPTTSFLNRENEWSGDFKSTHYKFKKNLVALLVSCLRPEASKMLDFKNWTNPDNVNALMEHAETLCQALCYMETLRVLCDHANKDSSRKALFDRYLRLVKPRLEAIYTDWDLRKA